MKLAKVLRRMRLALSEREECGRLARDLGDELARRRPDGVATFREALGSLDTSAGDPYVRGYFQALGDVAAAYEAASAPRDDDARLVELAVHRRWDGVLRALESGVSKQRELAKDLDIDPSSVSRILDDLRTAGLAERYALEGQDARAKPHVLTPRGASVLRSLSGGVTKRDHALLRAAARFFTSLQLLGRIHLPSFARAAADVLEDSGRDASAVFAVLAAEGKDAGLLQAHEGFFTPTPHASTERIRGELRAALESQVTPKFVASLAARVGSARLFVRSRDLAPWELLFKKVEHPFAEARGVDWGDLLAEGGDVRSAGPFVLLYETSALLKHDEQNQISRELVRAARARICVADETEELPADAERFTWPASVAPPRMVSNAH